MKTKLNLLAGAALPLAFLAAPAQAQSGSGPSLPPVFQYVDEHGVELQTGHLGLVLGNVSIGPGGPGSLSFNVLSDSSTLEQSPDVYGYVYNSGSVYSVVLGGSRETFTLSGSLGSGSFAQDQGRTSKLTYNSTNNTFTYVDESGTASVFSYQLSSTNPPSESAQLISRTYPTGETLNYVYAYHPFTDPTGATIPKYDVQAITTSLGYQLRLGYTAGSNGTQDLSSVVAFNMANETCDPAAASCALVGSWPSLAIDRTAGTITDALSRVTHMSVTSTSETITYPGGRVVTYGGILNSDQSFIVTSYNDGKGTWQYQYASPPAFTTLVFNPDNAAPHAYSFNLTNGAIATDMPDGNGALQIQYTYDSSNRIKVIKQVNHKTSASLGETDYTYDNYGRLTHQTIISATGDPSIDLQADYPDPASCTNLKYCNEPSATRDGNSKQTDYIYDPNSGNVATVQLPAPNGTSPRPQVTYTYTPQSASFRNGSGITISGVPAYRLTAQTQCVTNTTCPGSVDEIKTTIIYDPNQAILPVSSTTGPGNGVFAATTTSSYYPIGDVKTVDGPLAGTADTTRYYYDVMRQNTGVVGPRPDSTHAYRAVRTTYNGEGQATLVEAGTASGQGDNDMSTFAFLQQKATTYDSQGRAGMESLTVGGTTFRLTQSEYTAAGALHCTAVRMNSALFNSLPSSACAQSNPASSAFGPDLITQYAYDSYFHVTSITQGVGTSLATVVATSTYGPAGELQTVADARSNLTTYEYDGFYRLKKTRFPNVSGGGSSATDAELFDYDPASNLVKQTARNGSYYTYTYDGLNRVTRKTPSASGTNPVTNFNYDLLGRVTSAVAKPTSHTITNNLSYSFNALGPVRTDESQIDGYSAGKKTAQYDGAGRRIQLTWPDSFGFTYVYDSLNEMTTIKEYGGNAIQTFIYDDLGRRASRTAGNGTSEAYNYDGASNLLGIGVAGGTNPVQITLGGYSPAGQIMSRSINNTAYAWNGAAPATVSYVTDGQNKYNTIAGATQGYDPKADLTSSGGSTYSYGIENTMTTGTVAGTANNFLYDAFGRLVYSSTEGWFDYDGSQIVSEATSTGSITRRYAFGPTGDEPLVWYEGAGTATKRYLDADERGSVIRVTDGTGATLNINTYDEFGLAGSGNSSALAGRFQYTGQAWMPKLGLYYYKARMYSPSLGRFMQPDPLGLAAGPNIYNYADSDPVNSSDPSGTATQISGAQTHDGQSCPLCDAIINGRRVKEDPTFDGRLFILSQYFANNQVDTSKQVPEIVINAKRVKKPSKKAAKPSENCVGDAIGEGIFNAAVDSIGLLPDGGGAKTLARRLGNWRGYRGIVADNYGKRVFRESRGFGGSFSLFDHAGTGDLWGAGLDIAGFIPVVGQVAAGISIGRDLYKTWTKIEACQQ